MSILIGLLKILGIILALILVIIFIVIFSSINLKISFNNEEKVNYIIKIKYMLGILAYTLNSKNNINSIKIFGINIEKFKKNKNISKSKISKNEKVQNEEQSEENIYTNASINIDVNKDEQTENINKNNIRDNITNEKNKFNKHRDNIKSKIYEVIEKIKSIISYPNKKEILNLSFLLIKRLTKSIKFKEIKININYGLDDPFKTGNICGIISAIIPFLPKKYIKDIKIIPDFENELFLANLEVKCKTSLFKLLLPIIMFISKKTIREIIFSKGE